mgnify:FL=1
MRHDIINISSLNRDILEYESFSISANDNTNSTDRAKRRDILHRAILSELTLRQRDCVTMYYYENMKMKDIADTLSLSKSMVSRHIKAAQTKLKNVARYY